MNIGWNTIIICMLRQVIEVLVLPNSFRSVDFSRKGAYCLTFKLLHQSPNNSTFGYPFRLQNTSPQLPISPEADPENGVYQTQMFFIAFNSERFQFVSDGCLFRVEVPWVDDTPLELEVKLLHLDVESLETKDVKKNCFVEKAKKTLKILNYKDFYGDVIFGEFDYFCAVELTIQTTVLDYRFRLREYQLPQFIQTNKENQDGKSSESSKIKEKSRVREPSRSKIVEYPSKTASLQQKQQFLIESLGNQQLPHYYKKLITKQILNYQKLYKKLTHLLSFLSEIDALNFWRQYKMIPRDLSYLEDEELEITQKYIREKYQEENKFVYSSILGESNMIGKNIRYAWGMVTQLQRFLLKKRFSHFKEEYEVNLFFDNRRKYFRDPASNREEEIVKFKTEVKREKELKYPLIFGELFTFPKKKKENSLIIMMHGFQGSDYDMDLVKNYLMTYNKNVFCYVCHTLEGNNTDTIEVLGEKFAKEALNIMLKLGTEFTSVSFIGYSLGGIIIRAALKHLEVIKDKINVLLTLASPHLGISKLNNFLVKTGVWYMSKFQNYPSMKSLAHNDDYMEQLSKEQSLKWIKKLIVLGSKEDDFVPCYSAKIEQTGEKSIDVIGNNILQRVSSVQRIEVWFDSDAKIIDKLIGRKAHIEFLECKEFCQAFFSVYARLF